MFQFGEDFLQIINNSSDAICLMVEGQINYANPQFSSMFLAFANGSSDTAIYHFENIAIPEDRHKIIDIINSRPVTSQPNLVIEFKSQTKNNQTIDMEGTFTQFNHQGKTGYFITLKNITTRKAKEKKEREQRILAEALRDSIAALNSTLIFQEVINRIFESLERVVPFDTANIMLIDEDGISARIVAAKGYKERGLQDKLQDIVLPIKETSTLHDMYLRGQPLFVPDTEKNENWVVNPLTSWIRSYTGAPIRVKNQVIGFLNLNSPTPDYYTEDQAERLQAFADQAGIAINNAKLLFDLQRSNEELKIAYETTLQGWSKALELRDMETEGHCQRVLELTLRLAQKFHIMEPGITSLKYGALLHDIGKIGIPDAILNKPGPLTSDEWVIMKKHPVFAYQLLSQIPYLSKAIEIPYCHHERWDGTGYPNQIHEEEIPLFARLFSIVDVWDGLRSKRPYHDPWPEEDVIEYLKNQSGKQFQPVIVDQFIELIRQNIFSK